MSVLSSIGILLHNERMSEFTVGVHPYPGYVHNLIGIVDGYLRHSVRIDTCFWVNQFPSELVSHRPSFFCCRGAILVWWPSLCQCVVVKPTRKVKLERNCLLIQMPPPPHPSISQGPSDSAPVLHTLPTPCVPTSLDSMGNELDPTVDDFQVEPSIAPKTVWPKISKLGLEVGPMGFCGNPEKSGCGV